MRRCPRLTRLFLVACGLFAVACPPERRRAYEGRAFIFAFERDGQCQLRLGPDVFSAPPGALAIWEIRNECAVTIEPEVRDFRFEGSLESGAPPQGAGEAFELSGIFEPGDARRTVPAQGSGEIRLRVREDARPGRYNYGFRNLQPPGAALDPKIDIWPPI